MPDTRGRPGDMAGRTIRIEYRRLPDRVQIFEQALVHHAPEFTVTYLAAAELARPVEVEGRVVLEPGAPVVWFTYAGRWYDVGRFHLRDGTFTGCYANLLTPVVMDGAEWRTTDLCLDVWLGTDGALALLDADELAEAESNRWVAPEISGRARAEANTLMRRARTSSWPDAEVLDWTLDRARQALRAAHSPTPES